MTIASNALRWRVGHSFPPTNLEKVMTEKREHWGSRLGFILTAAGSAIGLGTMWKLPYVVGQNGGGAFVLLFLLFNLVVGIPYFIAELMLGRHAQRGAVGTFYKMTGDEDSSWGLIGWLSVCASFLVMGWYCVVAGWGLNYVLMTLTEVFQGKNAEQIGTMFQTFRDSGDLNLLWQVVFIAINATIVLKGLSDGIEKWSKLMTSGLFAALICLVCYSMTLSGFEQAVEYILYPDWSAVTSNTVLEALGLALFTLSLGYGVMVTYGSYMKPEDDIPQTSMIVGGANFIVSLMIALMIFPMVFTFGLEPTSGEGLIFQTLPYVFSMLPGSTILSLLFFLLLIFAAITSSVSMFEVTVANFTDLYKWDRRKAVWVTCAIGFAIGLPTAFQGSSWFFPSWEGVFGMQFMPTTDVLINWLLVIVAFSTCVFVGWRLDEKQLKTGFGTKSALVGLYPVWRFLVRWAVPICICVIILNKTGILDFERISRWF